MDLLAQMETFMRVVDAGSFSAAARLLRISTASVSRQVTRLEAQLGGRLLLRTTRKLTVTEAGRGYYARCVRILHEVDAAQESVREEVHVRGRLVVSAPVTYGLSKVWPHLATLIARHPGLRVDLRLEDRTVDLVSEGADVAIRVGLLPPESAGVVAHRIAAYHRQLVASPAYLSHRGEPRNPEALTRHEALVHLGTGGAPGTWHLVSAEREAAVQVSGALRTNALYALREAALEGKGVAFLPDWMVRDDLARGALRALLPAFRSREVTVLALHRSELRGAARVRALVTHLREAWPQPQPGA